MAVYLISTGSGQKRKAEECFLEKQEQIESNTLSATWVAPCCLRFGSGHPPEATGLAMDATARGALIINYLFLGPALLKLAENAAGCQELQYETCSGRIFGMKPTSLLSNIAVVAGMTGAILMPGLGAMVDHTPYRKSAGCISAAILVIINGLQAILNSHTWGAVVFLQILANFFFLMHNTSQYAYTSDLSKYNNNNTDNNSIAKYTAFFSIVLYTSMLLFLLAVISSATLLNADVVQTAIISQLASFVVAGYFFGFSWFYLFRECPPNSYLPQGEEDNLLFYGFKKNIQTMKRIYNTECSPLKWFYLSIALSEAAASAFPLIATTFMTTHLKMTSNEIGLAYLIVLLGGVPGSKLGQIISDRYNAVKSAQLCLVLFGVTTALAAILLRGPADSFKIMYLCVFWGMSLGWIHPTHITILCSIIPSEQTTELMGLYIFASQILSWLPPLFFTALNESGFSMSSGLVSLDIFFAIAMGLLFKLEFAVQSLGDERKNELNENEETAISRTDGTNTISFQSINGSHAGELL